jgi:hypothetical protein
MKCYATIERGPNAGYACPHKATMIVVFDGHPVCGTHARAWAPRGLIRLAYWNRKAQAWL